MLSTGYTGMSLIAGLEASWEAHLGKSKRRAYAVKCWVRDALFWWQTHIVFDDRRVNCEGRVQLWVFHRLVPVHCNLSVVLSCVHSRITLT
jgi:hypothetical protein